MNPPAPVEIPPSIGGTGLAAIAGLMLGRLGAASILHGVSVPATDWLMVLGVLGFVVLLLGGMLLARRRMGVSPTPSSIRRQWMVVGGGLIIGTIIGVISAS